MNDIPLHGIIGLTGGMGAGKSTLIEIIKKLGIPVFDTDATVHALYQNPQITERIGTLIGLHNASVTRADVASVVTEKPDMLKIVENEIGENLKYCLLDFLQKNPAPFKVVDAPLLFESGWNKICDFVIAIQCPIEIRRERVMKRPGMTQAKMDLLMSRQISEADRLFQSHYIIHNDGDIKVAEAKMVGIIEHLKEFYA